MTMSTNDNQITASIFGISRHRLTTDGEGVTTLVAFTGCPLRCKYCLNKQSWEPEKGRLYSPELLFEEVKIDQLYFLATHGGITFGGGEPLLQLSFLQAFRNLCGRQWQIVVETSLHVPLATVQAIDPIVDGYIIDIKDMNPDIYHNYTGKNNDRVVENLKFLANSRLQEHCIVRVPLIPEYNTADDCNRNIAQLKALGFTHFDRFNYR